jgi:L-gulonolactone oxidase
VVNLQVNAQERYIVTQGGATLAYLHEVLGKHGLAMIQVPSISDQTIAGMISAASHGSGIHFCVTSTQTLALTLLLADGSKVTCSRKERSDLFYASLCGLGCTGLILSIKFEVEPAFRLKELQETIDFSVAINSLDEIVSSAEHVRIWWFPAAGSVRVSYADRTQQVSLRSSFDPHANLF